MHKDNENTKKIDDIQSNNTQ